MMERRRWMVLAGVVAAILVVIVGIGLLKPQKAVPDVMLGSGTTSEEAAGGSEAMGLPGSSVTSTSQIPPFQDVAKWINSPALTPAGLQGKVVLVDFWTYSCVNCIRTLPYLKDWNRKYASKGLVIVGIHSPEFEFEKDPGNVVKAVAKYGVVWPVAMDNDMVIWKEYGNHYWPHEYLFDASGKLRHQQIGEGGYKDTEMAIRQLLKENGQDVSGIPLGGVTTQVNLKAQTTREIYAGQQYQTFGGYLGNRPSGTKDGASLFRDPGSYENNKFYLDGPWSFTAETADFSPGSDASAKGLVVLKYAARNVYAVMGRSDPKATVRVNVLLDGDPVPKDFAADDLHYDSDGQSYVLVTQSRMYDLIAGPKLESHILRLIPQSPKFQLYTFTFGG